MPVSVLFAHATKSLESTSTNRLHEPRNTGSAYIVRVPVQSWKEKFVKMAKFVLYSRIFAILYSEYVALHPVLFADVTNLHTINVPLGEKSHILDEQAI